MRSDAVKKGMQQAPHRSLFNALGLTEEEMNRPLVGIVSSYNEIVPGHMNLDKISDSRKQCQRQFRRAECTALPGRLPSVESDRGSYEPVLQYSQPVCPAE